MKAPSSYMKQAVMRDSSQIIPDFAPVAQMDRASACGAEGHRFESCRVYHRKKTSENWSFFYGRFA